MDEAMLEYLGELPNTASDESDGESVDSDSEKPCNSKSRKRKKKMQNEISEPGMRLYADFESEFTSEEQHKPTLLVLQDTNGTQQVFQGPDCAKNFLGCLLEGKKYKHSTVIFHGFGNYDGFLLLNAMHQMNKPPSKIIYRSGRILSFTLTGANVRFIDSYLFVNLPLAKMPRAFGINDLSKGYFPYKFLRPENRGYKENKMPPFESFVPKQRSKAEYKLIKNWYEAEVKRLAEDSTLVYDLEKQLLEYCATDVTVLRLCMETFRKNMMEVFEQMDPFEKITLPSYCNHVYRSLHMPRESLAILPPNGYYGRSRQSKAALAWMDYLEYQSDRKLKIRNASNGQEVKIGPVFLDGYVEDEASGSKHALEFFGCHYHGHLGCQDPCKINESTNKTMLELYKETVDRLDYLENLGFNVVHIWECEFNRMMQANKKIKEFVERRYKYCRPLAPREALRGGRTNANYLYYKAIPGESIKLYDYTSLYPSVQLCTAGQWWPVGHPQVFTWGFPEIDKIFGLIKRIFLAPKRERFIAGSFVSAEIQEALCLGYKCIELHEVWHWPEEQGTQDQLFGEFIRASYREKVEASGYPPQVVTEEQKKEYVDFYKNSQGVMLRPEKIEKNPGRRTIGKATVTNLWGFFCKNGNPLVTKYVKDYKEICKLCSDKSIEISEVYNPYGEQLVFRYKKAKGYEVADEKCNVVIGNFTTAFGRLRLNECLQILEAKTIYFNTDSVIWIDDGNQPRLVTGPLMGDLTDEILEKYGPNAVITEFISSGAKSYALIVRDKNTGEILDIIQKLKGFRLCVQNESLLNENTLKKAVFSNQKQAVTCTQITKDRKTGEIHTKVFEKIFRNTYDKRLRLQDYSTLPYGWVAEPGEETLLMTDGEDV